jgi:outer membrane protein insertion porin family
VGGSAAAFLAGRLTRSLGGLGLDQVSIQPELVTREGEVETGARFTFGKRLSPRVNLVYSLSLQDPEGRFIQVEVSPGRAVALSVRRTDAGSFTYGAGQRFRFGGFQSRADATDERVRVREVRLEGDLPKDAGQLRTQLHTGPGDRKTVWDLQDDADRLRGRLLERGYLEAEVSARFEGQAAVFTVRSGSQYRWRVSGMDNPPDLTRTIRSSLFEEEALDLGRALLLTELRRRGHLRAAVQAHVVAGDTRTLVFEVLPGQVLQADVTFPGAVALSTSRLLEASGGAGRLLTDPGAALRDIRAAYHDALYLGAEAGEPRVVDGARASIVVSVREGPRARLAAVRFEGSTLADPDLIRVAGIETGVNYEPGRVMAAVDALRGHYFGLGYASVRVNPRLDARGTDVELVFEVTEGERVTVAAVVLQGLRHAREGLVRRQVQLAPGDPLDPRKVAELERRLLDLGLFTRASATVSEDNPATVRVTLEEGERLRAGYLLSYNDERGSRAELDGELRKLLGAGISLGARLSAGPDIRDARVALSVPALLLPTGRVTLSLFRLQEDLPLVSGGETLATFERIQTGGQIQGTRPIANLWNVLYGYRLKNVSVTSEFLNSSHRVAGLDLSLLRDTRDSPVDARRGRFLSFSLEISPRVLGSDFNFVKGYAQAFLTHPLSESLTWAQGYRLGLAHAFGGEPLVADEGFEAGGANSIRGFDSGEVGREDSFFGQQGVIVLNQELRYHHRSGFGGAFFYDAGNTFKSVSEMSLRLRHVLGAGLRWNSPVGLLRVDFGTPLFPRPGESRYKIFFSLGQAF